MSGTLSPEAEFRYIVQWFNEWSELQKDDFIPILVQFLKDEKTVYVNGIVNSIANTNCNEKPLNLFQCRVNNEIPLSSNYNLLINRSSCLRSGRPNGPLK